MTLTAILPGLRRSIPDPLDANAWPERTRTTTTDVIVAGVSLVRLVDLCDTPCVHTAAGVVPGTGGRPAPDRQATAIVVAVTGTRLGADGRREIFIDGCLDDVCVDWTQMRLIGRASCSHARPTTVLADTAADCVNAGRAELPEDVRTGDLLAVPCPDAVVLRRLRSLPRAERPPVVLPDGDGQSRRHWLR